MLGGYELLQTERRGQVQQELCGGEVESLCEEVGFEAGFEYGEGGGSRGLRGGREFQRTGYW